jgi:cob(I)alamin adenosyltransferase
MMELKIDEKQGRAQRKRARKGLVIVHTGPGKGKTTAALGTLLRAWGRGLRCCMIQFIKHEQGNWGEVKAARQLGIEWHLMGDGFTWLSKDVDDSAEKARQAWRLAQKKITSEEYELIILDEFTYPLLFKWLDVGEVIDWLQENKPPMLHLIITGRDAPPALIEFADLVTEMHKVKHPFDQGIKAQAGIEY